MNEELLNQVLPEAVRRLRESLSPLAIYVVGSCARGDFGASSDLDLVVVVESSSESFAARCTRGYRALRGLGAPVDLQVYTREEFESRASLPVSFERTVRSEGRVLYAA